MPVVTTPYQFWWTGWLKLNMTVPRGSISVNLPTACSTTCNNNPDSSSNTIYLPKHRNWILLRRMLVQRICIFTSREQRNGAFMIYHLLQTALWNAASANACRTKPVLAMGELKLS
jgi:hypothetical protein